MNNNEMVAWAKLHMEPPPPSADDVEEVAPKLDPTLVPGYARAKALIADHLQPFAVEWSAVSKEGESYTRKAYANFHQAYAIRKDDVLVIMMVGSYVSRFWDRTKGCEVASSEPLPLKQPLHRLTGIVKAQGRMVEQMPTEGYVKLWPGPRLLGQMPRFAPEEDVPALLVDGWLKTRPTEVLA